MESMHYFYVVAITNDHKISGLKQLKFIIRYFCRPEVQDSSEANNQVLAGLGSVIDTLRKRCFFVHSKAAINHSIVNWIKVPISLLDLTC